MFYFCGGGSAMLNVSANYQTLLVIALTGFAFGILVVVFMGHRYRKILCAMRKTYHLMRGQERRNETIVEALPVGLEIYNTDVHCGGATGGFARYSVNRPTVKGHY